jgi:DUF1680 family protein
VDSTIDEPWTLALRVPAWCEEVSVRIDGVAVASPPEAGYLRLTRVWSGQVIELSLAMPPRVLAPHPRIDAVRGCVALARGPLIYSLEQSDLPQATILEDVALDPSLLVDVHRDGGETAIPVSLAARGQARNATPSPLYQPFSAGAGQQSTPVTLTAVPYFLWGNRRPGPMRVWIPMAATPAAPDQPTG